MNQNSILIIDDEATIRVLLGRILELEGYNPLYAKDRSSALELLNRKEVEVQVILCDVFLPDGNGVSMVKELKQLCPQANVILLTAHGNIPDGVQAIKNGAFDYIVKGDDNRKIIPLVSRAMADVQERISTTGTVAPKTRKVKKPSIVGSSPALQKSVRMAEKVAMSDVPVLLTGETGTGKEVFARAIHEKSSRNKNAFVAINCSAFSRELLESELFGYKAGSFTGAMKDKKGLFEEADEGTLFLDEIGEMEYSLQAKLLRALETGEFIKIGETKPTKVNIRIIAATNRDLKKEIDNHLFREDLYFRLSVFQIELPPLRERLGDVRLLVNHFIELLSEKMKCRPVAVTPECMKILEGYTWPGNIRELKNVIERSLIVCDNEITVDDLPVDIHIGQSDSPEQVQQFDLASVERSHIAKILAYTKGNKTETARLLKIGLTTLYRKIDEYGL